MTQLYIQRLSDSATLPHHATSGDLGYDLFSAIDCLIEPGAMMLISTGIALQFPDGWGGIIKDRSSMAVKRITTSAGVIDCGYRGEVKVLLTNNSSEPFSVTPGQKIAQMVPVPVTHWAVVESENLTDSERGIGGFGSTDSHD